MSSKCTENVHFLMEQRLLIIGKVRIQRKGIYLSCCYSRPRDELQAEVSLMDAQKECVGEECYYSKKCRDR